MKIVAFRIMGWLIACILLLWRKTCRYEVINDPRPALRAQKKPYVYALLHAHLIAAVCINDDGKMVAMVSQSADGELLVPSLRVRQVIAARGSTRSKKRDKGGLRAMLEMIEYVRENIPALVIVDGPQGPRGCVHNGVVEIAKRADAMILPFVVIPDKKFVLHKTWDKLQIPMPFSRVRMVFATPCSPLNDDTTQLKAHIQSTLAELETTCWESHENATDL